MSCMLVTIEDNVKLEFALKNGTFNLDVLDFCFLVDNKAYVKKLGIVGKMCYDGVGPVKGRYE